MGVFAHVRCWSICLNSFARREHTHRAATLSLESCVSHQFGRPPTTATQPLRAAFYVYTGGDLRWFHCALKNLKYAPNGAASHTSSTASLNFYGLPFGWPFCEERELSPYKKDEFVLFRLAFMSLSLQATGVSQAPSRKPILCIAIAFTQFYHTIKYVNRITQSVLPFNGAPIYFRSVCFFTFK